MEKHVNKISGALVKVSSHSNANLLLFHHESLLENHFYIMIFVFSKCVSTSITQKW